jgi:uncharacterized membrane protein
MTWLNAPQDENSESEPAIMAQVDAAATRSPDGQPWALIVAILWAIAAVIVGLVFILGVNGEAYGGDAYTGIEAAIVTAVHAVGWVIISTGVLGVVIAGSRPRTSK